MEKIITKNLVIKTVGTKLAKEFSADGFKYVKSKQELIRKYKGGFDKIDFTTYDMYPISHQELSVSFKKRLDIVENIVNKFYDGRFINPKFHKDTITIYPDVDLNKEIYTIKFKSENNLNCEICSKSENIKTEAFILHTEEDIENIINSLIPFIREKILLFFKANDDLQYVNKKEKERILKNDNKIPIIPLMHSLVLMKLTNDLDFNKLKKEYLIKLGPLQGFEEESKNALNELITYLDSI